MNIHIYTDTERNTDIELEIKFLIESENQMFVNEETSCAHMHIFICEYVFMYTHICLYIYVYIYIFMYIYIYIYIYMILLICMYLNFRI
jgi:hypothetical protein